MECNILFAGVGSNGAVINQFQRAMETLGIRGKLIAADHTQHVTGLMQADESRITPKEAECLYVDSLLHICESDNIRLLIPLRKSAMLPLSFARERFKSQGTLALVSDSETIQICLDQPLTHHFFTKNWVEIPIHYDLRDVLAGKVKPQFPLLLRSASESHPSSLEYRIENTGDLEVYARKMRDPWLEEWIEGKEFLFDAYVGLDGVTRTVVPRLSVGDSQGEKNTCIVLMEPSLSEGARKITENLPDPLGPMTIRAKLDDSGLFKFMNIFPCFDRGTPLSILSGADSPLWILSELLGIEVNWSSVIVQDGGLMKSGDQEITYNHPEIDRQLPPVLKPEEKHTATA
ncbi:hypothetical protein ACFLU6_02290 [Acidobacteriota bacterium]